MKADFPVIAWAAAVCLCGVGCTERPYGSKNPVKKAPVTGIVMMNGEPLADAEVFFYTERFTGFGKTDSEGKYKLLEGAAVGLNKVFFSKQDNGGASNSTSSAEVFKDDPMQAEIAEQARNPAPRKPPVQLIPKEYADENATDLTFDVPAHGATDADFFF